MTTKYYKFIGGNKLEPIIGVITANILKVKYDKVQLYFRTYFYHPKELWCHLNWMNENRYIDNPNFIELTEEEVFLELL